MKIFGSVICSVRSHGLMLSVAGLLVAGAQSVTAQTFGDFETGLDGFFGSDNSTRTTVVAGVTNYLNTVTNLTLPSIATSGSNVVSVTQERETDGSDNFDWSLEVSGLDNPTFAAAVSNAVMDTNAFYDVFFEGMYVPSNFPGAGTASGPAWINHLFGFIVGPNWVNSPGSFGPSGGQLGLNFTNDVTIDYRIRIEDYANMTPENIVAASNNINMILSLNGNWDTTGVENAATVYYDNFRVVKWDPLLFDFEDGLQGWFAASCAGSVVWGDDDPDIGDKTMRFLKSGAGECAGCSVVMTPGQHAYEIFRNLIRYQNPDDYVLKVDLIIDTSALHPTVTFLRPRLGFSLTTYEEVTVVDTNTMTTNTYFTNVVTDLPAITFQDQEILVANLTPGITSIPLEVRLNEWTWPSGFQYDPVSIRMNLGHEIDGSGFPPPVSRVWFDNIEIGDYVPLVAEKTEITSISRASTNVTLTWLSQAPDTNFFGIVTPVYYGIERTTDLEADSWEAVAANLLTAYPSERSFTLPAGGGDQENYRVSSTFDYFLEVPLYDFEEVAGDLEHWALGPTQSTSNFVYSITNSTVTSTKGSNSLAFTVSAVNPPGNNYWGFHVGIPSGSVQYVEIVNALNDPSNAYYLTVDVIYRADDMLSNSNWFQIPFAWNSFSGGWVQPSGYEEANFWVPDLLNSTNEEAVVTLTKPLADSGWAAHTGSNDYWQFYLGAQGGDWALWSNMTYYIDNVRLRDIDLNE